MRCEPACSISGGLYMFLHVRDVLMFSCIDVLMYLLNYNDKLFNVNLQSRLL